MNTRYHECSMAVKAMRWVRFMPIAYVVACREVFLWIVCGAERVRFGDCDGCVLTRLETAAGFFSREIGRAQIRMGQYITTDELKDLLEARTHE